MTTSPSVQTLGGHRTAATPDHRGSWIPSWRMIRARFHELRRRRGLMILLAGVTIGLPTLFLAIRLIAHAVAPNTYAPAGGHDIYVALVSGVLYVFGFIVAATLGATAGSVDLTEGMFRHHVITGRSRLALYFARIPAGLGIIVPLVAIGFAIVCAVCVLAAPTTLSYQGVNVPAQLSEAHLVQWAEQHPNEVLGNFSIRLGPGAIAPSPCLPGPPDGGIGRFGRVKAAGSAQGVCTPASREALAAQVARQDYADYSRFFLTPSTSLMVKSGLWIELEAVVAFLVGLGLASVIGQRTVTVVLMVVLEIILTPIAIRSRLPHLINLQRSIIGAATAHVEPGGLPSPFGGNGPGDQAMSLHMATTDAVLVIVGWVVIWTVLGAWRMATRDT